MDIFENTLPEEELEPRCGEIKEEETQPEQPVPEEAPQAEPVEEAPGEAAREAAEEPAAEAVPVRPLSPFEDSPYVTQAVPVRQPKARKPRRKRPVLKTVLCAVLILALVAGSCVITGVSVNSYWEQRMDRLEDSFESKLDALEDQISRLEPGVSLSGSPLASVDGLTPAQVYAKNVRSVVMIYNEITLRGQTGTSTGSGFILTADGYVVTNHHVVENSGKLSVVTSDGTRYSARLVGSDNTNDVAVLKIEATGLQAVTLGSSTDLIVGDQVVAIGNPLGELTSTLTVGYVSAKERDVNTDGFAINMLQTDAAINSGNSGGPLFNMRGEVVGITTAKYSGTSSSGASIEGVGFAIPIDDVRGLLTDLATLGYISGAYLGVSVSDMDPVAANYYGLPVGAYVQEATEGYAAFRAGVQPKDIIVKLGSISIGTVNDLTRALRDFEAGDETTITVYRSGKELVLSIVLDPKPSQQPEATQPQ